MKKKLEDIWRHHGVLNVHQITVWTLGEGNTPIHSPGRTPLSKWRVWTGQRFRWRWQRSAPLHFPDVVPRRRW